jgi:hypothetical protein
VRTFGIGGVRTGITRLRDKGGASAESLYDLVNGWVTAARSIRPRPGTRLDHSLPAGTKGLANLNEEKHVFAHTEVVMTDPDYVCDILRHPTDPTAEIIRIPFAEPFLNALYVVAVFDDGNVFHYWLEQPTAWSALTVVFVGQRYSPTVANGFIYEATRIGDPYPKWAPDVERSVGDKVEPTVANGYYYEVSAVYGSRPRSGSVEPDWVAAEGAFVIEDIEISGASSVPVTPTTPTTPDPETPDPETEEEYENIGGVNDDFIDDDFGGGGDLLQ